MGPCGPPKPLFHGDPPNLLPVGSWAPPETLLLQWQGLCVPVPMGSSTPATPGPGDPMSPHRWTGSPCWAPTLRGDPAVPIPRAGGSILALPTCSSREAPPGGTRGRCHFRAGCANTTSTNLCPLTHAWAPHKGGCRMGPPKSSTPLVAPSPHPFFLSPLSPIEF